MSAPSRAGGAALLRFTCISLFSGIGGMDLAFERAGFNVIAQVEIDDYCNKILERHWPTVQRFRDVRAVGSGNLLSADVIFGGFPCQDISNAGKRAGIKEGTRSGLWFQFARIIGEIRPRIALLENVAAITSRDGTRVLADLAALGYDAEWGIIPASAVGAPHRRERWWCVAYTQSSRDQRERCRLAATQGYPEKQNDGAEPDGSNSVVVYPHSAFSTRTNDSLPTGRQSVDIAGGYVVNANGERLEEQRGDFAAKSPFGGTERASMADSDKLSSRIWGRSDGQAWQEIRCDSEIGGGGQTQSILGRAIDGLSRQLDSARWPARPGEAQYPWEARRTTTGVPDRAARLKALGNSVVPQVVQPIAEAIKAHLEEEDYARRVAADWHVVA